MLRGDSDARDVAQETFIRLWSNRELVRDEQALLAWLYRTATRLVIDRARHQALGQENLTHLYDSLQPPTPRDSEARFVTRQELRRLLSSCTEAEIEATVLHRVDRLTQLEIAEVMGVGERTVRRLLRRFDERTGALHEARP